MQVGTGIFPIPVIPLVGAAFASGDEDLAFAGLAAFTVLTLLLNARPPVRRGRRRHPRSARPALALADPLLADPGEVHRGLHDLLLRHLPMQVPPVGQ